MMNTTQGNRMTVARLAAALAVTFATAAGHAGLPPPTPAQQQAAAAKKAQADAQAAKDKELLAASMDAITARWRTRAATQGWKTHAPIAIAAAAPAGAAAPIRSEKLGTAAPSTDVKAGPTKAEPQGTAPTVQKGTPKVNNK